MREIYVLQDKTVTVCAHPELLQGEPPLLTRAMAQGWFDAGEQLIWSDDDGISEAGHGPTFADPANTFNPKHLHPEDRDDVVVPIDFEVEWEGEIPDEAVEWQRVVYNPDGTPRVDENGQVVVEDVSANFTDPKYNVITNPDRLNELLTHCSQARVKVVEEFRLGGVAGRARQDGLSIVVCLQIGDGEETISNLPYIHHLLIHEYGHNAAAAGCLPGGHRYDDGSMYENIMNWKFDIVDESVNGGNELNASEGALYILEEGVRQ